MTALERLAATITARKGADPDSSWTAKLLAKGPEKCAEKFGEEAIEAIIEAVKGDRDPGYGSTSKMISEAALCLLQDSAGTPGGIWTPGAAMGSVLMQRLQRHAGLSFAVEND